MSRIDELRAEIAAEEATLELLERAILHIETDEEERRIALSISAIWNNVCARRDELDEAEDMASMRERASDRAYGRWIT